MAKRRPRPTLVQRLVTPARIRIRRPLGRIRRAFPHRPLRWSPSRHDQGHQAAKPDQRG